MGKKKKHRGRPSPRQSAAHKRTTQTAELFQTAYAFFQQQDFQNARAGFGRVLEIMPDHVEAIHLLGLIEVDHFDSAHGLKLLHRSTLLAPANFGMLTNYGTALEKLNKSSQAVAVFEKAADLEPDNPLGLTNFSDSLRGAGRVSEAEQVQRRLCELQPNELLHRVVLGEILYELGRVAEAEAQLKQALELGPDNPDVLNAAGVAYMSGENYDAAHEVLQQLVGQQPGHFLGNLNLGILFHKRDQRALAITKIKRAIEIQPTSPLAWYNLGFVHHLNGDLHLAIEALSQSVELDSQNQKTLELLARVLVSDSQTQNAIAVVRNWLQQQPDNPIAKHMLASITGEALPARASDDYVQSTFDEFSKSYELVLSKIKYKGPELIAELLSKYYGPVENLSVLDAGCGTGLCGPVVRPLSQRLVGVDLSQGMLRGAHATGLYDELVAAELVAFLLDRVDQFDLIISGDTFNYFGDLKALFSAAFDSLKSSGRLVFTLESHEGLEKDYVLNPHGRYSHRRQYFVSELTKVGFEILEIVERVLRVESEKPVAGLVVAVGRS